MHLGVGIQQQGVDLVELAAREILSRLRRSLSISPSSYVFWQGFAVKDPDGSTASIIAWNVVTVIFCMWAEANNVEAKQDSHQYGGSLDLMVPSARFERAAFSSAGRRSNPLSYEGM